MKIKNPVLRELLRRYDSEHSEIDFNDRVSSEKYLEVIIQMYEAGYCEGFRDRDKHKNPRYILAICKGGKGAKP